MAINYIGLDFEASGSNPWQKHVPIQIGMSIHRDDQWIDFESKIGRWDWNIWDWSEEAFEVHKITKDMLVAFPPVWVVDIMAANWLIDTVGWANRMYNITVGWNVAGYDRQFVTRWMPNLNRLLSYRTVDLNSIMFLKSENEEEYKNRKKAFKAMSAKYLGYENFHDALYDAKSAIVIWEGCKWPE